MVGNGMYILKPKDLITQLEPGPRLTVILKIQQKS